MWFTCVLTVAPLTTNRSAISAFVSPSAISASTSTSRGVSPSGRFSEDAEAAAGRLSAAMTWCWTAGSSAASPRPAGVGGGRGGGAGLGGGGDVGGAGVFAKRAGGAARQRAEHRGVVGERR